MERGCEGSAQAGLKVVGLEGYPGYFDPTTRAIIRRLEEDGYRLRYDADEITFEVCPFCIGDTGKMGNQWKLGVNVTNGAYHCFRCNSKGHISQFLPNYEHRSAKPQGTCEMPMMEFFKQLWESSVNACDDSAAALRSYLEYRGLKGSHIPASIRFIPNCKYVDDNAATGHYPTMVARVDDQHGAIIGVHRIYLSPTGRKASVLTPKKSAGRVKGGAVHLAEPTGNILAITEGVETGLAVYQSTGIPTWAALSTSGMESLELPNQIEAVYVFADLDKFEQGQEAAGKLAERMTAAGKRVFVVTPGGSPPMDWLDVLNENPAQITAALSNATPYESRLGIDARPNADTEGRSHWPEPIGDKALHGIAGDIVRAITPHTESDPVALLVQFLTAFGNCIGRSAHAKVEKSKHYLNLFSVLVGDTSKGRKGTSLDHIVDLFEQVDSEWASNRMKSGLSTGEGVLHSVRDRVEIKKTVKDKITGVLYEETEVKDEGVTDKRLFVIEPEFSSVLRITAREGNNLSQFIRLAWDKGRLETVTKHSPEVATNAHVSIVGHITTHELRKYLSETESLNGFGNRFLWVSVKRSQILPFGGQIDTVNFTSMKQRLMSAILFGRSADRISFDASSEGLWIHIYTKLSQAVPGLFGAMTARSEPQVLRLACLYAVLDESSVIRVEHLQAALALWDYCEESCLHIFGANLGDRIADRILDELKERQQGMTRSDIRELFDRKVPSPRIEAALSLLAQYELAHSTKERTTGRPAERWFAKSKRAAP